MNNTKPDLNLLIVFDAVARTGSVSAAAQSLSLSQPAVSHALGRLRKWADDPLFVRNRRGVTMTPRADAVRAKAKLLIAEAQQLFALQQFVAATTAREFTIGTSDYAAVTIIPTLSALLRAQAPNVNIVCSPFGEATLDDLAEGRMDLSFWAGKPPLKPVQKEVLYQERFVGVMSATHPLAKGRKNPRVTLKQYVSCPHVVVSMKDPGRNAVERELAKLRIKRRIAIVSHSFLGNLHCLHNTDLLSAVPSRLLHAENIRGIVSFTLPITVPHYDYGMIWHERVANDPAVQWLRQRIAEASRPPK